MSRYDVNSTNSNRTVRFEVDAAVAEAFTSLKGTSTSYPYYDQVTGVPTDLQNAGQLRMSLVARALSAYAVLVGVEVADNTAGDVNAALVLTYETDQNGVFFNNASIANLSGTELKHTEADIDDTVGTGGMNFIKSKAGLQTLADALQTVSYDGDATFVFPDASFTMPDGTTVAAPAITTLVVTYIGN